MERRTATRRLRTSFIFFSPWGGPSPVGSRRSLHPISLKGKIRAYQATGRLTRESAAATRTSRSLCQLDPPDLAVDLDARAVKPGETGQTIQDQSRLLPAGEAGGAARRDRF